MIVDLHIAHKYVRFLSGCTKPDQTRSPFADEFYKEVLKDNRKYYSFLSIEKRRSQLLRHNGILKVKDPGAGSRIQGIADRRVSDLAKYSAGRAKYGRLLFRIVNYFNPENILELGTSLGLSTAYLASARSRSQVTTLEGSPEIIKIAEETFEYLQLENITIVPGNFDDTLEEVLTNMPSTDLVFIDGNHRKEPTLRYFNQFLSKINSNSILIFGDIYWSKEMEEAWETIKKEPLVRMTIDTFNFGLVFFRNEIKKKKDFKFRW